MRRLSGLCPLPAVTVLCLWLAGLTWADQRDPRLDALFAALSAEQAPAAAELGRIEADIWSIWSDSGKAEVNVLLSDGIDAMRARRFNRAAEKFDQVVAALPDFAEGWNKRATLNYLRDRLDASMHDVRRTLALEPRHFGALSGMGLIFLQRGDLQGALQAFREVLKIHPHSASSQTYVELLERRLKNQVI